jgi:hypothetical protein
MSREPARATLVALAVSLLLASLLELWLRVAPSYDAFGWLAWGKQTLHLALDPSGAPSWKPFTWLLATPAALTGTVAPGLWVTLSIASGLLALWLAYRLAARLGGAVGGIAAVIGILLCRDLVVYTLTGNSEPFALAFTLGAVESHIAGRRRLALFLGTLVALIRPEFAVILLTYLLWLWRSERRLPPYALGAALTLPALWFIPPYLATGHRFSGSDPVFHTGLATPGPLEVISQGVRNLSVPLAILIALGAATVIYRGPATRRLALGLGAVCTGWLLASVLMTLVGFPAIQRFTLPAAATGCVLAAAGIGFLIDRVRMISSPLRRVVFGAMAIAIIAASATTAPARVQRSVHSIHGDQGRSWWVRNLFSAVDRAGGESAVRRCGWPSSPLPAQSTLAWKLGLAVGSVGFQAARDLATHPHVVLFTNDRRAARSSHRRLLARAGPWLIVAVRPPPGCRPTQRRG